jgi:tetratricopeptide (TPR) repeat protein
MRALLCLLLLLCNLTQVRAGIAPLARVWLDYAHVAYTKGGTTEATKEMALAHGKILEEGMLNLSKDQTINEWWNAVFAEAQLKRGATDLNWAIFLYEWIAAKAQEEGRNEWAFHVRGNLVKALMNLGRNARSWELMFAQQDYFLKQGFSHDTTTFPARGPWFAALPDVLLRDFPLMLPNGKHVVSWQRRENGNDASAPLLLDNMEAATISNMATAEWNIGRWQQAMEKNLWLLAWADEVSRRERDSASKVKPLRDQIDQRVRTSLAISTELNFLGFEEQASEIIKAALANQEPSKYHDMPRFRMLCFQAEQGSTQDPESALKALQDILHQYADNPHADGNEQAYVKLAMAKVLDKLKRTTEADAILEELLKEKKYTPRRLSVRIYQVQRGLEAKSYAGLEEQLNQLLIALRKQDAKLSELVLFRLFVRLCQETGQLAKSLNAQKEILRIIRAFNLYPLEPAAVAKLAVLQQQAGDVSGARASVVQAKHLLASITLGKTATATVRELLAQVPNTTPKPESKPTKPEESAPPLALQPRIASSMAIANRPARASFSLSNPTNHVVSGVLSFGDTPASIQWDEAAATGRIEFNPVTEPSNPPQQSLTLQAGEVALFEVSLPASHQGKGQTALEWTESGTRSSQAVWQFDPAEQNVDHAVIDAGIFSASPFYLIPIYHHLQMKTPAPANLRITASEPTRIELYDGAGHFAMTDARGNGSLTDPGDQLAWDADRDGWPEITPQPDGEAQFVIYAQALQPIPAKGIELKVEWKINGAWVEVASDQIMPSP